MQQNPPANPFDPNLSLILGCLYKLIHIHSYAARNSAPEQQAVASLRTPNEWIWISLRGEVNGMTDLVQLYLCEMHGKPEEAVVGARAVSLQRFSLGVFELIDDHSFAFVHCQVVLGNATAPGTRCTKKCSLSDRKNVQLLMMSTGPIILSLGWQEKKRNCSDSCIYTSFSMLGTRGSNRPNSLVPRVLFLRLSRGREVDSIDSAVWEISLPPSPYCKFQMLFTFGEGGQGGQFPVSRTTFFRLPYFCKLQMFYYSFFGEG